LVRSLGRGATPQPRAVVDAAGGAAAWVAQAYLQQGGRSLVVVAPSQLAVDALAADLRFVLADRANVRVFAGSDQSPYAEVLPDRRAAHARIAALAQLGGIGSDATSAPDVWVVGAEALTRRVVPPARIREHGVRLELTDEIDRDELLRQLTDIGYLRVPLCEDVGTLSVRGGLVDVWPPGQPLPLRIELDGDLVASIKRFDPEDQRSRGALDDTWLLPATEMLGVAERRDDIKERLRSLCDEANWPSSQTRMVIEQLLDGRSFFGAEAFLPAFGPLEPLCEQLPPEAAIVMLQPGEVSQRSEDWLHAAALDHRQHRELPSYPPDALCCDVPVIAAWLARQPLVVLSSPLDAPSAAWSQALPAVDESTASLAMHGQDELARAIASARAADGHAASLEPLLRRIDEWHEHGMRVVLAARTTTQAERLALMLRNRERDVALHIDGPTPPELLSTTGDAATRELLAVTVGGLAHGTVAPTLGIVTVTEEEIFGTRAHRRRRASKKRSAKQALDDLRALAPGDHVVHIEHGIGRYRGLMHREVRGHTIDLLVVEYAGGDKLYLPVYRLNQVQKFHGNEAAPKLDKLGGQSFARTKSRTKKKVREMADQLLRLYAERQAASGEPTPAVDDDFRAFEASFPYEETDDQARAITEVGADLEMVRPMDRLVCGDVGFGKTEVALRAAFRVAMGGRQVAVLCPTTVLAQQHQVTFAERLGAYPIQVATMSRFQSKKQQTAVTEGLRNGAIDVVVGTHRVLSKDVRFRNLGLLVVDEEQRFGVAHKERIKALKTNVDVLTLTATPIPRTLQMAVTGLRDLSLIATPPADRRAVRTMVTRHDPAVLREAIERELQRGGQVFFVYNRIAGLAERASFLQDLVPEARIAVAHGQMNERALERTMLDFVAGDYDVLCSTAIIENGLDIPRCNTIIIDRADLFGLGQLYQLRGRVGRARERGYCYLVLPSGDALSGDAKTRIEALQRYSDLGSGFQIASLDLELRGAGDVLGAEQSGAIATVGFELFCKMLSDAVHELRGDPVGASIEPELSFDAEALLPEQYVDDIGVRLSLYKRLASAADAEDVQTIAEELEDRFGPAPPPARRLMQLMTIKTELRQLRVLACEASSRTVTLQLRDDTPLDGRKLAALVAKKDSRYRLSPDMRLSRSCSPSEGFDSGLDAADRMLAELQACV
jgi:transcription-repair coupling factor (superfamily II helicase)